MVLITTTTLLLVFLMITVALSIVMTTLMWPFIFYPVKVTIRNATKRVRTDYGKFVSDEKKGKAILFLKTKNPITGKRLKYTTYTDNDFSLLGKYFVKQHLDLYEESDGTMHVIPFTAEGLKADIRDIWPVVAGEVDDVIESTKQNSLWVENKALITIMLTGVLIIGLIAVGGATYIKAADKRVGLYNEMAQDPVKFCKSWSSSEPLIVRGNETVKLTPIESVDGIKNLPGGSLIR